MKQIEYEMVWDYLNSRIEELSGIITEGIIQLESATEPIAIPWYDDAIAAHTVLVIERYELSKKFRGL